MGSQVQEWRLRKEELMELSRKVVEKRLGQKEDVEPGMSGYSDIKHYIRISAFTHG